MAPRSKSEFRYCPRCGERLRALTSGADLGRMACERGHFVDYDNPAATAIAFVERDARFLVLERAQEPYRGRWELPGGFIESGESPAEAVQREVHEETGLAVAAPTILGAYASRYGDDGRWTIDVAFHCSAPSGEVRLSFENSRAKWVVLDQMPELAFRGERSALQDLKQIRARPDASSRAGVAPATESASC